MRRIKQGLNLPINGVPKNDFDENKSITHFALLGQDYKGMKPTMHVSVGDHVQVGQLLFECKKQVGVRYTSPVAGEISQINRGPKRVFESIVIKKSQEQTQVDLETYKLLDPDKHTFESVRDLLVESGLWTSLKTRPFSKNPTPNSKPVSIFVNAMDTNPLCLDPSLIIEKFSNDFQRGVEILSRLTEGKTFVCHSSEKKLQFTPKDNIEVHSFSGPHPAGNTGTHIHFLSPVSLNKTVWCIDYQDAINVGKLFSTGKISFDKYISLAGPKVQNPRIVKTVVGASLDELLKGELSGDDNRVISGSVLNGFKAYNQFSYLGRYHNQVSIIREDKDREFLGWIAPGAEKYSTKPSFVSKLFPSKLFNLTSSTQGSPRAMVPTGNYESVMPLDILATQLLRALITKQTDLAVNLGCLELEEEDLALCTFVDHGKVDYGPILRENLDLIEKEG